MRGRKPRARTRDVAGIPVVQDGLPRCPPHLSATARREWRRLATPLYAIGVLTLADRAAMAAYCQAYGRWVEAEEKLKETPILLKTPSGYVQQSPWLSIANKQLELMGRFMAELGLTPVARSRVAVAEAQAAGSQGPTEIRRIIVYADHRGESREAALPSPHHANEPQSRSACTDVDPEP